MKPQKKSIRDFFAPKASTPQRSQRSPERSLPSQSTSPAPSVSQVPTSNKKETKSSSTQFLPASPSSSSAHRSSDSPKPQNVASRTPSSSEKTDQPTFEEPQKPQPDTQKRWSFSASMNTSFDTQPPGPSQSSTNTTGSKRIISNGEQVVLNSDSDSDSLDDLDFGDSKASAPKVSIPIVRPRYSLGKDEALRKPARKVRSNKRSFNRLVETAHNNIETERQIKEHKESLAKLVESPKRPGIVINESILGQAVGEEEDADDKAHRLLLAIQRTNAHEIEHVYYFFDDSLRPTAQKPFPAGTYGPQPWNVIFKGLPGVKNKEQNQVRRDHAFLSRSAYRYFRHQPPTSDVASWMIDQICSGEHEGLSAKYLEILQLNSDQITELLDPNRIGGLFENIKARTQDLQVEKIEPIYDKHGSNGPSLPPQLKSMVKFLHAVAPRLTQESRCHALLLLWQACLDDRVSSDADILSFIQDAIEAIICNFADSRQLITSLEPLVTSTASRIRHPLLQKQLICAMPCSSPLTAHLQRYFALCLLLYPTTVKDTFSDPDLPGKIHDLLDHSPDFKIKKGTNYGHIAARVTLLDIAIGPGLLSVPYQPLVDPPSVQEDSQGDFQSLMVPLPETSEVKAFNMEIDALAQHIKILGNSIIEASASVDLAILDAKDGIERLVARLEHAVRIGGKKVHNVFGDEDEEDRKQLRVNRFFTKMKVPTPKSGASSIFGEDDGTKST